MILPAGLLADIPPAAAYPVITGVVALESVLLLGPFVPTLTLLLVAGGLAHAGTLALPAVIVCAAAGAVAGDLQAHRMGSRLGGGLRTGRLGHRVPAPAWDRACAVVRRRGRAAVLICRFLPLARTLAPHAAGAAGLPYRSLAPYSAAAGTAWAGAEAGAGYAGAASLRRLIPAHLHGGAGVLLVVAVVAGAVLVVLTVRVVRVVRTRRRRNRRLRVRAGRPGGYEARC
ncbi:DedA family protein [Streptomyces roseoverticillatus]|uniref:DedA family protein n=1 Tax=Streptomyces roseoverticillatus TaxID=66429 RepID=UPI0006942E2E|nr:VTT domain-containing protein [Streptomyces roseoverticillatus]